MRDDKRKNAARDQAVKSAMCLIDQDAYTRDQLETAIDIAFDAGWEARGEVLAEEGEAWPPES